MVAIQRSPEELRDMEVDEALRELGEPLLKSKALRGEVLELFCAYVDTFSPFDDAEHQGSPAAIYRECLVATKQILNGCQAHVADISKEDAEAQVRSF